MTTIHQIIDEIIDDINQGIYDDESMLPSENELANLYDVSRMDIRRVYERLSDMGYVKTAPGVGRFVTRHKDVIAIHLHARTSFTEKMQQQERRLTTQVIARDVIKGRAAMFAPLHKLGGQIMRVSRLRKIDDEVVAIHTSYLSTALFPDVCDESVDLTSMYCYYRDRGYSEYYYENSILNTVLPTESERLILKCPSLVPVMVLKAHCYDKHTKKLIEISNITYRGDRFVYNLNTNI